MDKRWEKTGIRPGTFLLPATNVDINKWAVIACDQFTSQQDYWQRVEKEVGDNPSTFHLVLPEAWLEQEEKRRPKVIAAMKEYIDNKVVVPKVQNGFVLIERSLQTGKRLGLLALIDLEEYAFDEKTVKLIRPTEGTVMERIPPRLKVREKADLEFSHVILLVEDKSNLLFEPLYKKKDTLPLLYDFDLMESSGHLRGWSVEGEEEKKQVCQGLLSYLKSAIDKSPMLFAVGDGNHSLATAKTHWEKIKKRLTAKEQANHPGRFATVEIQNMYDKAIAFEPIHRVVFNVDEKSFLENWDLWCKNHSFVKTPKKETNSLEIITAYEKQYWKSDDSQKLTVAVVQNFLDMWLETHPEGEVDYIHGEDVLKKLVNEKNAIGILLPPFLKESLISYVEKNGTLPRKTFSIGHAHEKRFYMEGRNIKETI